MLDTEIDLDDEESDEVMLARVAEENNVVIEVHSNSLETPVEYYGEPDEQEGKEVVRIFKSYDDEMEDDVYQPIVKKDGTKRNTDRVEPLRRENRFNVKVHTNPDVKVFWNLSSDIDLSRDICSCIIDCEVVDMWPQRFEELKVFIDENERRPLTTSKTPEEKSTGSWLHHQQHNYKYKTDGMKDEARYALWTQFLEEYNEYFVSAEEIWLQKFEELKSFIGINKRRPSTHTKTTVETQLGRLLSGNQKNYKNKTVGMKNEKRYNLWSQFLEDYKEYFISPDELWFQNFKDLRLFIDANKSRPCHYSKNPEEKQLGSWVCNQLHYYKNKIQRLY